ncbi:MAG: recombinase RecT [Hungatella sp.]|jgi:recombination protein RecT|nr:recombinase RecT [Hungatella sp.]
MTDIAQKLSEKAKSAEKADIRLTKSMTIPDMVKALEPEIKRALPAVLTPERFTRMALSALNNTPKLAECTPMSFIAALMNAAQLGLEPNTPLGQAFLIPYKTKNVLEVQFQIGFKGLITLAYRNERVQSIEAHTVYENDVFDYELGLNPKLVHRPCFEERGNIRAFYAVFRLDNGGFRFEVMSRSYVDAYAARYSKAFTSDFSPWKNSYEGMAKKTVIKQLLKYAPMKSEFQKAVTMDETIKTELSVDMSEIRNECLLEVSEKEVAK